MRDRNKRKMIIYALVIALTLTTVGYAVLDATLNISGTVVKKGTIWNIYFTNLSDPIITGKASANNANALSSTFTFDVNLSQPGDSISYTVDIKNAGTIDAELSSINLSGVDNANNNNIDFKVAYNDGNEITKGDRLNVGESKKIKVTANFMGMYSDGNTDWSEATVSLGVTLVYVQTEGASSNTSGITSNNVISKIYGNSIQNGIPSPSSPVEIESVGEKTVNLFDISMNPNESTGEVIEKGENYVIAQMTSTAANTTPGSQSWSSGWLSYNILLDEDKTYTISYDLDLIENTGSFTSFQHYIFIDYGNNDSSGIQKKHTITNLDETNHVSFTVSNKQANRINFSLNSCKWKISNLQIEEGSSESSYEPYGKYKIPVTVSNKDTSETVNIILDEPLRKIGNYTDYVDLENGTVVRNIYSKTVTGTESIGYSTRAISFLSISPVGVSDENIEVVTSNYYNASDWISLWRKGYGTSSTDTQGIALFGAFIRIVDMINYPNADTDATQATAFKTYFANKYANGNPLIIDYVLETPTTETITIPDIPELSGNISYNIGTSVQPSNIDYDVKS